MTVLLPGKCETFSVTVQCGNSTKYVTLSVIIQCDSSTKVIISLENDLYKKIYI